MKIISTKKTLVGILLTIVFVFITTTPVLMAKKNRSPKPPIQEVTSPTVPNPMILAYGYGGIYDQNQREVYDGTLLNQEGSIPSPNVVEVDNQTENRMSVFLAQLRAKPNLLVARKVKYNGCGSASFEVCVSTNVELWKGYLDSYEAISIDELSPGWTDSSVGMRVVLETLERVKTHDDYKDKLIFVWGNIGRNASEATGSLAKLKTYADRYIDEIYLSEDAKNYIGSLADSNGYFGNRLSANINRIKTACLTGSDCYGILDKTIIGLGTADTEDYSYDRRPDVDFGKFLDLQMHYIKNDSILRNLPGIGFYAYSRTQPSTIAYINKLARHYYLDNQTNYFNNGSPTSSFVNPILNLITNSTFKPSSGGWAMGPGTNGEMAMRPISDASIGLSDMPGSRVPKDSSVLYMKRGSSKNEAVAQFAPSGPFYQFDVYAKSHNSYIRNRGFEEGDTYWTRYGTCLSSDPSSNNSCKDISSPAYVKRGNKSFRIADAGSSYALYQYIDLRKGSENKFILSGWVRLGPGGGYAQIKLSAFKNDGSTEDFKVEANREKFYQWQYISKEIQLTSAHTGRGRLVVATTSGSSALFDDIHIDNKMARGQVKVHDQYGNDLKMYSQKKLVNTLSPWADDYDPRQHRWTRFRSEVKVPPGTTQISVVLTDDAAVTGDTTLWDFVQFEPLKGGSLAAGVGGNETSNLTAMNGGFELGSLFWTQWRWGGNSKSGRVYTTSYDTSPYVHDGKSSLIVESDKGGESWYQDVFLQNGKRYKISGWVRYSWAGKKGSANIALRKFNTTGGGYHNTWLSVQPQFGSWQYLEQEFDFDWTYKNVARLYVQTLGNAGAIFDNLKIEVID